MISRDTNAMSACRKDAAKLREAIKEGYSHNW